MEVSGEHCKGEYQFCGMQGCHKMSSWLWVAGIEGLNSAVSASSGTFPIAESCRFLLERELKHVYLEAEKSVYVC